ncbi:MAG: ATP-binding protein [Candidatus Bathyarchaeia archaeon]
MRAETIFLEEQNNALQRFVQVMLPLMLSAGGILLLLELRRLKGDYLSVPFLFHLSVLSGLIVLFLSRARLEPRTSVFFMGVFLFADTAYSIISYGIEARSLLGIGYLCIFTGFVFRMRWGIASLAGASSLLVLKGVLLNLGYLNLEDHLLTRLKTLDYWTVLAFCFLLYPLPLIFLLSHTKERLKTRIEELLRISEALDSEREEKRIVKGRLEEIVATPVAGFFILENGRISEINKKGCEILGIRDDEKKVDLIELIHPGDREVFYELLSLEGGSKEKILRIVRDDGIRYAVVSLTPLGKRNSASGTLVDVTKEKMLEAELQHAKKTEAVARFVEGIAHDFNNLLTAIEGYTSILAQGLEGAASRTYVDKISLACERARKFTKDLILFGKNDTLNLRPTQVNAVLLQAEGIIRQIVTEDTHVEVFPSDIDLEVMCDTEKMERVFFNLASNAKDAMENKTTKRIALKAEPYRVGSDFIRRHGFGRPGLYGVISISDTGCGMSGEIKKHIFEPFFTTKEKGKGTGLGLSIVYSVIKDHGGYITVESDEGDGSTFHIYLPAKKVRDRKNLNVCPETSILAEE